MRFLPLTMAQMGGEGVCVAGVDLDTREWVRPVASGRRCLFTEHVGLFIPNCVHELRLGAKQRRDMRVDPDGRHTEDRVLAGPVSVAEQIEPREKLQLLGELREPDLRAALVAGGRSLFLVGPEVFATQLDVEGAFRWQFSAGGVTSDSLRLDAEVASARVGVSGRGCKGTCPLWERFAGEDLGAQEATRETIERLPGRPTLFLTLSLSALKFEKYWLIVAGVHVVGRGRIWL